MKLIYIDDLYAPIHMNHISCITCIIGFLGDIAHEENDINKIFHPELGIVRGIIGYDSRQDVVLEEGAS